MPTLGQVKLRISGTGNNSDEINSNLQNWTSAISEKISKFIYGYGKISLAEAIGKILLDKNATLSTAESCTGGYIAHHLTPIPGSSAYYMGSIIAYDNAVKTGILGVLPETIEIHGAVSEEVCKQMAAGVLRRMNTDYAIATTGIAGPGGGTDAKPVGTVWIAVATSEQIITKKVSFNRSRLENIQFSCMVALDMLRRLIHQIE